MFITQLLLKKAKSKKLMVLVESVVTGHKFNIVRERLGDKLELMAYDPYLRGQALYRELKKVRSYP